MKCPKTFQTRYAVESGIKIMGSDCLEEKCALWDDSMAMCAELSKSKRLGAIFEELSYIRSKMPHEGQFRK